MGLGWAGEETPGSLRNSRLHLMMDGPSQPPDPGVRGGSLSRISHQGSLPAQEWVLLGSQRTEAGLEKRSALEWEGALVQEPF